MPVLANARNEQCRPLDAFERRLFAVPEGARAWWYSGCVIVEIN